MKEVIKKTVIEIVRVILTSCLAVVGISSTGCVNPTHNYYWKA